MTAPSVPIPVAVPVIPNVGRAAFFGAMLGAGIALVLISAAAVRIALERGGPPLDVRATGSTAAPPDTGTTSGAPAAAAVDAGTTSEPVRNGSAVADAE